MKNTITILACIGMIVLFMFPSMVIKVHYKLGDETAIDNHAYYKKFSWKSYESRAKTMYEPQIVFFGDSRLNNIAVENAFNAVNFSISGERVQVAKDHILSMENMDNKTIVLALGVNDLKRPINDIVEDFRELDNRFNDLYVTEVLLTDRANDNIKIDSLNTMLKQFNFIGIDGLNDKGFLTDTYDGVHLTEKGNELWLELFKESWLKR